MMLAKSGGPPSGYTQLKYLQSDGTQWINTEYILQSSDTVELKAEYAKESSINYTTTYLCGSDLTYQSGFNIFQQHGNIGDVFGDVLNDATSYPGAGVEFVVTSSISELSVMIGDRGTLHLRGAQTYTPLDWPVYLFTTNRNGTAFDSAFVGKIYYAKITNSQGKLTFSCIPCLDTSGVPCMFDLVSRKPFYNVGTGSFTWG